MKNANTTPATATATEQIMQEIMKKCRELADIFERLDEARYEAELDREDRYRYHEGDEDNDLDDYIDEAEEEPYVTEEEEAARLRAINERLAEIARGDGMEDPTLSEEEEAAYLETIDARLERMAREVSGEIADMIEEYNVDLGDGYKVPRLIEG